MEVSKRNPPHEYKLVTSRLADLGLTQFYKKLADPLALRPRLFMYVGKSRSGGEELRIIRIEN